MLYFKKKNPTTLGMLYLKKKKKKKKTLDTLHFFKNYSRHVTFFKLL